jgi:hypothetical protein
MLQVRLLTWQLLRQLLATTTSAATLSSAGHAAQDATLHQQPPTVWGQDPAALAPVFGVLISSSLTAAAGEVGAPQGSREVAAAALESLQRMLVLLGPGDALAFFLPGVASGLGKVLAVTGGWERMGWDRWVGWHGMTWQGHGYRWCSRGMVLVGG